MAPEHRYCETTRTYHRVMSSGLRGLSRLRDANGSIRIGRSYYFIVSFHDGLLRSCRNSGGHVLLDLFLMLPSILFMLPSPFMDFILAMCGERQVHDREH